MIRHAECPYENRRRALGQRFIHPSLEAEDG